MTQFGPFLPRLDKCFARETFDVPCPVFREMIYGKA